jgi:amino acid transporter
VLTTYAGDVYFGPTKYVSFGSLGGGSPWIQLARDVWGLGWVVAFIAILNSTFANGNAGTLATTRTWYAMSRIGLLPAPLARLHPRWNSPSVGVVVQLVLTLAIGLPIGIHFGPTTAFVFLATILTGIMIAIYMVFNLSCLLFYLRRRRAEFNVLLHAVIPVLGILAFIPAWLTALGIGSSFLKFVTPLSYPASETGLIIGSWFVIGLGVLAYLCARHPERLPEMKKVFADDAPPASGEPVTSGGAA